EVNDDISVAGNVAEETDWGNKGLSLKWAKQWSPRVYTRFLVAGTEYFSEYNRNSALDITVPEQNETLFSFRGTTYEDNRVEDLKATMDVEWLVSPEHKISTGISYTRSKVDYRNIRDQETTVLQREQESGYASIYISDQWTPIHKLDIEAGIRASKYELTNAYLFSPRFSFNYNITEGIQIKGGYGRHYQFVNRIINDNITEGSRDFWLLANGKDVKISNATHYIGGASYENRGWLFNVEAYYKDLENISEFSLRFRRGAEFVANELFFTGDGIAKGVEFLLQKKQGDYTGWASYTLGSVRNTFPGLNDGEEFPALHDQRHEYKMVHNYKVDDWNFSATFIFGSGKPFSEPAGQYSVELLNGDSLGFVDIGTKNGSRLPAYHRLDVSAHYKFTLSERIKADLGASIFNLYNRSNVWYYEYDFNQSPVLVTAIEHLGLTPNLSFTIQF
ncbi:MAG: TonB-dependent receptor plug domain-containing protein, partial [Flavobacteriaceae bacterium]